MNDEYYLFGMSMQGFQFRLKNIILHRRRYPYTLIIIIDATFRVFSVWSKRTVNARDVRKILDYLRRMFAERLFYGNYIYDIQQYYSLHFFDYMQTMEQTFEEVIDRHRRKMERNRDVDGGGGDKRLRPMSQGAINALHSLFADIEPIDKDESEQHLIADHYFIKLSLPVTRTSSIIPLKEECF